MLPKIADTNCIEITIYLKPESQNLQYNALAALLTNTFESTGLPSLVLVYYCTDIARSLLYASHMKKAISLS